MKNKFLTFLLLFACINSVFAQKYYDKQWKTVADNYKNGTFKSNLPIILEIQNQAMKDDNAIQLIRSLKGEFSIINQTYDDTKNNLSTQFFAKIQSLDKKLKGEDQFVFQVLKGEFFMDYYNQNQWEINQRTNINNEDFSQIETWTKLDFKNYLSKHFSNLSSQKVALQNISMFKYKIYF